MRAFARARKRWSIPRDVAIVVLDGTGHSTLAPLFGGRRYEVIHLNGEVIYVHPRVLFSVLRRVIATRQRAVGYVLGLLEWMKPSIVVTFVDNSTVFQTVGQQYRSARFLAVQNGARLLHLESPAGSSTIRHREFACFGRLEIDEFTRHGAQVEAYYPIGSLRDAYYRTRRMKTGIAAKEFDLCIPSQLKPWAEWPHPEAYDAFKLLTQHVRRFCEMHGKSVCVALRTDPYMDPARHEQESQYLKELLGDRAQMFPGVPDSHTTYDLVDRSRVSIGMHSTVLREAFGRWSRVLSCNYTGNAAFTFPVPGPWTVTDPAYDVFEQRLLWLLNASEEEYANVCGDGPSYVIGYDDRMPTGQFLQELIADAVRDAGGAARPVCDDSAMGSGFVR